jgi:hypothetical protein
LSGIATTSIIWRTSIEVGCIVRREISWDHPELGTPATVIAHTIFGIFENLEYYRVDMVSLGVQHIIGFGGKIDC